MPDTYKKNIDIIPRRLMDAKKAEDLVAVIKGMNEVAAVDILKNNYRGGGYLAGRFIITLKEGSTPESFIEKVKPVLEQTMTFGYDINQGVFIKPRATVKDYVREATVKKDTNKSADHPTTEGTEIA